MEIKDILSKVDHTLLSPDATWPEIKEICDEGIEYGVASVCIPPSYVKKAKAYVKNRVKICTVVGFPNGYNTTAVKCFETEDAVNRGADEIDMVINIGWLRDGRYDDIYNEITDIKRACAGKPLKVIIETCLLTEDEKIKMCEIISRTGADYIKTSTGFGSGGATKEDAALFAAHVSRRVKIKAAGGISSLQDAEDFIGLGVSRLGTSKIVKLIKKGAAPIVQSEKSERKQ